MADDNGFLSFEHGVNGRNFNFVNIYPTLSCGIQLDNFGTTLLVLCHKMGTERRDSGMIHKRGKTIFTPHQNYCNTKLYVLQLVG